MPHTAKTRQFLIYVLIAAVVAPLLLLRGQTAAPPSPEPAPPSVAEEASVHIDSVRVEEVTDHSAVIRWRTNVPADSQATFGEKTAFMRGTPRDVQLTRDHRVVLEDLESGVTYKVFLVSASGQGQTGTRDGISVRTKGVAGLRNEISNEPFEALRDLPSKATGLSVCDYDNDGDLDLFVCAENYKGSRLFRNDRGTYRDVTQDAGLLEGARAAAWADYDRDGDFDLVLSAGWKVHLFENTGPTKWTFQPSPKTLPRQPRYSAEGIGWLDYDRDGHVDLLISNGAYGILLYRNTGRRGQPFADASADAGLGRRGIGVGLSDFLSIADLTGDGFPDFLYNIRGRECLLAQNARGRSFTKVQKTGLDYKSRQRVGFALGDYDNDGDLDVFVPMSMGNRLYRNDGPEAFTDVTAQSGELKDSTRGSSAAWGDIDNDGDLDLFVGRWYAHDEIYASNGDGTFRLANRDFRLDDKGKATARGVAFFDADGDGDVDLFVNNRRAPNVFYINQTAFGGEHNSLVVTFSPKTARPGATVKLATRAGKLVGFRHISGGEGWGSQPPPQAHFGCPPGAYVVQVDFADGKTRKRGITTSAAKPNMLRID